MPVWLYRRDERQAVAVRLAQQGKQHVVPRGAVAEHHWVREQFGQAFGLRHGETVAVGVVIALGADGVEQMPLGIEHGHLPETSFYVERRRSANLERVCAGEIAAGNGIDLIAETQVVRALPCTA